MAIPYQPTFSLQPKYGFRYSAQPFAPPSAPVAAPPPAGLQGSAATPPPVMGTQQGGQTNWQSDPFQSDPNKIPAAQTLGYAAGTQNPLGMLGPTIASLLKGMFFNKGGYINGPLAPAYNKGGPVNKSLPISPKQMLEKKLNEEYKFAADLGMVRDDEARARKEEFEKTILGKLFGGGSGKDISGRIAARELAAEQVQKQYPALMKRLYGSRSK
jgi:hypothetical protein